MPRLSKIVTCCPGYVSRRSGTRFGSLASVKPLVACDPSQNGLAAEAPHRHRASWGARVSVSPSGVRTAATLVTR